MEVSMAIQPIPENGVQQCGPICTAFKNVSAWMGRVVTWIKESICKVAAWAGPALKTAVQWIGTQARNLKGIVSSHPKESIIVGLVAIVLGCAAWIGKQLSNKNNAPEARRPAVNTVTR